MFLVTNENMGLCLYITVLSTFFRANQLVNNTLRYLGVRYSDSYCTCADFYVAVFLLEG